MPTLSTEQKEAILSHADAAKFADLPKDDDGNDLPPAADVLDFRRDAFVLAEYGVGFGDSETNAITSALNYVGGDGVSKVRFFGKIFGQGKDYYVAEGKQDAGDADPEIPAYEA